MSSTFHHIFDGYWLCLDRSSSCVEINCFVLRGKTAYYGLVSLRLTRGKGSVPSVTLVNLILSSDIEEIWIDGIDNSYVSDAWIISWVKPCAKYTWVCSCLLRNANFLRPLLAVFWINKDTENWEMKSLSLSHGRVFDQINHVLNTYIPGGLLLCHW